MILVIVITLFSDILSHHDITEILLKIALITINQPDILSQSRELIQ